MATIDKNKSFYDVLGVSKTASEDEIKKAYRKMAVKHHPDRGGNTEDFQHLNQINEVLSNPEKRRLYDLGGLDAVNKGSHGDDHGADIFDIFGGGRRQAKPRGPTKADPVQFPLSLSLEDIYKGTVKKLRLTRSVCCVKCKGEGGETQTCGTCQGRGVQVITQRMGNMISQQQVSCRACNQKGKSLLKRCVTCNGEGLTKEVSTLEVNVTPGARAEQTVIFPSMGDQPNINSLAGDVIVEFKEKEHAIFKRKGHHLFMKQTISLQEALLGFTMFIKHLDGRDVQVTSTQVLRPGDCLCIKDAGLTHSFGAGKSVETGNLYIEFDIQFPGQAQMNFVKQNPQAVQMLQTFLQAPSGIRTQAEKTAKVEPATPVVTQLEREQNKFAKEEKEWQNFKAQQNRNNQQSSSHYDEEDDHHGGAQMGGCQQM